MKKLPLFILLFTFGITAAYPVGSQNPSQEKKLETITKEIEQNESKIRSRKRKEKTVVNKLGRIKRDIRVQNRKLSRAKRQLNRYQKKIQSTQKELQTIQADYQAQSNRLSKRLVSLYKNQNMGMLQFLFSPTNFTESLSNSYTFEKLLDTDITLVKTLENQAQKITSKKEKLASQKQTANTLKKNILSRKKTLRRKSSSMAKNLGQLRKEIRRFEKRNQALYEDSQQITNLIQKQPGKKIYYGTGKFIRPSKGWLSSRFGTRRHPIFKRIIRHTGIDLAAPKGYEIKASNSGYIIFAGRKKGYGNVTIINHGWKGKKRISTVYAHQWRILAKKGQFVRRGQLIGYVGSTGYSTGPHLHFEVRHNGVPTNPLNYIKL
ncbi:peptidoglycan DD-metalloendopeptidase family protein [bacterium]|jgi:murein DD-endopeptidase MepM/ murein hydrolase activator NlpD|nr:peptidoglycan DD-metalloendopeptidase family protein [bacterium]